MTKPIKHKSVESMASDNMLGKWNSEQTVVLALCALGILSIIPFLIYRLLETDWIMALVDGVALVGMLLLFVYVVKTRKTDWPKMILTLIFLVAINLAIFFKGPTQIYWAFPATMAIFFLLPPKQAITLVAIALVPILLSLSHALDSVLFSTIMVTIVTTNLFALMFALRSNQQNEHLLDMAIHDPLTGAHNRRALEENLEHIVQLQKRRRHPVSLILFDLDHFKRINDHFGHNVGDKVLIRFCEIIRSRIRITDRFFRFGGEEFVIIGEGAILEDSIELAEHIRQSIEHTQILPGETITVSAGIAEYRDGDNRKSWFEKADKALLLAKESGRNRVQAAGESSF